MERIQLHDKFFKPFIPNSRIEEAIDQVAEKLNNDYCDKDEPIFLSVLNGSFMFTASLMGRLKFNCEISFVKLASYTGTESTGCISKLIGLSDRVKGRKVVIIEDVTTAGTSIGETLPILQAQGKVDVLGLVVSVDRMERGQGEKSALCEISEKYGFKTCAIVTMKEVIEHLYNRPYKGKVIIDDTLMAAINAYYEQYGAK